MRVRSLVCAALLLPIAARAESWVALTDDDVGTTGPDLVAALEGTGLLAGWSADVIAGPTTPDPALLAGVDAIVVTALLGWEDPTSLGDLLVLHLESGGEIVLLAGATFGTGLPGGAFSSWSPIEDATPAALSGELDWASVDPAHPLWDSLTDLRFPDGGQGALTLSSSGSGLAWDLGGNLIAATRCDRAVVVLDLWPGDLLLPDPPSSPELAAWIARAILVTQIDNGPFADIGGPYFVSEGDGVTLDGTASDPGDLGPVTWSWDLDGDGSFGDDTGPTPLWSAAGLDGPESFPVAVRVTDACGREHEDNTMVEVQNLPPEFGIITAPTTLEEGAEADFGVTWTDAGPDAVEVTWVWGDNTPNDSGEQISHVWLEDGAWQGTITLDDGDGGVVSLPWAFAVDNLPPTVIGLQGTGPVSLSMATGWAGLAVDPGVEDPLTWRWDWGDGSPFEEDIDLTNVEHVFAEPGPSTGSLTVTDDEGGSVSLTLTMAVWNPGPTAPIPMGPATSDEGDDTHWAAASVDAFGTPLEIVWSWSGDPAADPSLPDHTWTDDGSFWVTATATDAWGATADATAEIIVQNIAPLVFLGPGGMVVENEPWPGQALATDPGDDPPQWSLVVHPVGATITPSGAIEWTPAWADALAGTVSVVVHAEDGDGGMGEAGITLTVQMADVDGDGMPDTWELAHALDNGVADGTLDPDGDGVDNLDEWLEGSDPQIPNLPGPPIAILPDGGSRTGSNPELVAEEAVDPDGDALLYDLEVHCGNPATLAASVDDLSPAVGTVSWTVDQGLPENTLCDWRIRAWDGRAEGAWSNWASFYVDAINEAPTVPTFWAPTGEISTNVPLLQLGPTDDAEEDEIFVSTWLTGPGGEIVVAEADPVVGGWEAVPPSALGEGLWTVEVRSSDARGASAGWSVGGSFVVDATNIAPERPVIVGPEEGSRVASLRFDLQVAQDVDDVGRTLSWQLDRESDFSTAGEDDGILILAASVTEITVLPTRLQPENHTLWFRARLEDDRGASSPWAVRSVILDAVSEAPPVPHVLVPGEGEEIPSTVPPRVEWTQVHDPEGFPVSYEIRISDGSGTPVVLAEDLVVDALLGTWAAEAPLPPAGYRVTVRALDPEGLASPWSPPRSFMVASPGGPPFDLGDGAWDGGCVVAGRSSSQHLGEVLGVTLIAAQIQRRRRRQSSW